jgi:hypothetical protein
MPNQIDVDGGPREEKATQDRNEVKRLFHVEFFA